MLKDWLAARAILNPQKLAIAFEGQQYTFDELNVLTAKWAGRLAALSVSHGDVVALLVPNSIEFVAISFAVMRLQAVLLPLNTRLTTQEVAYQLDVANAKFLLTTKEQEQFEVSFKNTFYIEQDYFEGVAILENDVSLEDRFCILFTSGTTGKPKAVCLSLKNFYFSANASAYRLGLLPNDNWLCAMPLYHVGGLSIILRSCLYGTSVTLHSKFDLEAVTEAISSNTDNAVSLVSLVPTMLYRILNQKEFVPSNNLRLVLLGGAAASKELLEAAKAKDIKVAATYGLSETCSQVATVFPDQCYDKVGTVGKALMFTELQIVNDKGLALGTDKVGELQVRGPTVMQGYLGQERSEQDWFSTGDMGYVDSAGDLFIKQRRSDLIVSGGENVYPSEVEAVLRQSDFVQDVVVFGVDHAEWGQQVTAAVTLEKDVISDVAQVDMRQLCERQLAGYKQPKRYIVTDSFPMTASGKVRRLELPKYLNLI